MTYDHRYINNYFPYESQCSFAGSYPLTTVLAFTYYKTAPACHVQIGAVFCLFGLNVFSFRLPILHFRHSQDERERSTALYSCCTKEGDKMNDSNDQRIQNQFGGFCTKVLKNEAKYIQRENARLRDRQKSINDLSASEEEQLAVTDKHFVDEHIFDVLGLPIVVTGDLLAGALARLSDDKRNAILLSYYLGMTDREISEQFNVVRQTITKRRNVALKELRKYLMKEGFECPDI